MQGATNINGESFSDNADADHPLNNDIYIPEDVVQINKVRLAFKRPSFRGYVQNTDHSHSFTLEDHKHEINFIPEHTHKLDLTKHTHDIGGVFSNALLTITDLPEGSANYGTTVTDTDVVGTNHQHRWPDTGFLPLDFGAEIAFANQATTQSSSDIKGQTGKIDVLSSTVTSKGGGGTTTTTQNSGTPTYGIHEPNTEADVNVDVNVDGTTVTTVTDLAVGQEVTDEIELKNDLDDPLTGTYHSIELVPTGRCRLQADVFKKVFIESTV